MKNRFDRKMIVTLALLACVAMSATAMKRKDFDGKENRNQQNKKIKRTKPLTDISPDALREIMSFSSMKDQ